MSDRVVELPGEGDLDEDVDTRDDGDEANVARPSVVDEVDAHEVSTASTTGIEAMRFRRIALLVGAVTLEFHGSLRVERRVLCVPFSQSESPIPFCLN